MRSLCCLIIILSVTAAAQIPFADGDLNNRLTPYEKLSGLVHEFDRSSDILKVSELKKSVEGRTLYLMQFSREGFGKDESKIKILIFAQQHGNEHSGKEGALKLAAMLVKPEFSYLFDKIDLALIPQMNPDGSEADRRLNANKMDLNRNHLILSEPETKAMHKLFNEHQFEVTVDVHEYYPFGRSWEEFGYYKSADEQIGLTSNLNVSEKIRKYSKGKALHFIKNYIAEYGFTSNEYLVGGPPSVERVRNSTVDINDGRQSLGIQNSLSFIIEGKNGKDSSAHRIEWRAQGQAAAMLGILKFAYENADEIKAMIREERESILNSGNKPVIIRMEHTGSGATIEVPALKISNMKDTVITLNNFHPIVSNLLEVIPPEGYLIPADDTLLLQLLKDHNIKYNSPDFLEDQQIEEYQIASVDSIELEETMLADVKVSVNKKSMKDIDGKFVYVPVKQIKRNTIVTGFEPQSMLGIIQYPRFAYLLKEKIFPIRRVL
jgi:hypothetical protein